MSGALHKTMVYLGLKDEGERFDDEYYDDVDGSYDGYDEVETPERAEASVTLR